MTPGCVLGQIMAVRSCGRLRQTSCTPAVRRSPGAYFDGVSVFGGAIAGAGARITRTWRHSTAVACGHQRRRAGHPAFRRARCAKGRAPTPRLHLVWASVDSVSGQGGVPPWPSSTKSRLAAHRHQRPADAAWHGGNQQRGHVPQPVASLGGRRTSPLTLFGVCKVSQCARLGFATRRCARGVGQCCASVRVPGSLRLVLGSDTASASQVLARALGRFVLVTPR